MIPPPSRAKLGMRCSSTGVFYGVKGEMSILFVMGFATQTVEGGYTMMEDQKRGYFFI
jgi:hypothetical protein